MARSRLRRVSGARKALLRSLVTALFQYGRITTTESKAKRTSPRSRQNDLSCEERRSSCPPPG